MESKRAALRDPKAAIPCPQVLYLTEPIDEVTIQNMAKYGEHAFVDVSKEEIDLGEDEDEKAKASSADMPGNIYTCPACSSAAAARSLLPGFEDLTFICSCQAKTYVCNLGNERLWRVRPLAGSVGHDHKDCSRSGKCVVQR